MLFSFVGGGNSICPGAALEYVPRWWVGKSCVVHVALLFVLKVYASIFGTSWWGEMVCHISHHSGEWGGFPQVSGPGYHRVQFLLILCLLLIETKKERETTKGLFSPGQIRPDGCAAPRFSLPVGATKNCFKGQSLKFYVYLMCWWFLFWLEAIRITQVQLPHLKVTELRNSDSLL
jgi:hypothetical protein